MTYELKEDVMVEVTEPLVVREQTPAELDETGRVLMRAAEIVRERGLCRGAGSDDGSVCLLEALAVAEGKQTHEWQSFFGQINIDPAFTRIAKSLGVNTSVRVWEWNDAPGRTAGEVADALERAAIGA